MSQFRLSNWRDQPQVDSKGPHKDNTKNHKTFEIQSASTMFDQFVISCAMHEFLQMGTIDKEFKRFSPADLPKEDPVADANVQDAPVLQRGSEFVIEQQLIPYFSLYLLKNKHNILITYLDSNARLTEMLYKTYIEGYPKQTPSHPNYDADDRDHA
jgi:hypothetical protein